MKHHLVTCQVLRTSAALVKKVGPTSDDQLFSHILPCPPMREVNQCV